MADRQIGAGDQRFDPGEVTGDPAITGRSTQLSKEIQAHGGVGPAADAVETFLS
ncbi:hypothetical protein [Amycolatopsis sulphurea]|uniref:hypothetical protein n=1 Tax=Amycolatopsis sulphurea TaxID=76022 RepID=UPI001474DC0D|nr:hypothetical protein [Amycolatopsis sulphurea]